MVRKILLSTLCSVLVILGAMAQSIDVQGTIIDETGTPVLGAAVTVVGTSKGTSTGLDGTFRLTNVASNAEGIQVTYIGYQTQTLKPTPTLNVTLVPDSQQIEAVVVTGMTTQDKRLFTGAADHLAADDVKLAGMPDISRGLEGRSAGVSVQNVSGTFGSAPKIRIRGATSIFGSSKPLWVVDGVILDDVVDVDADALASGDATTLISSAIAGLNAEDIESFNILKDGSATSIYGARAMAGVIVITTKKGRAGESRINYSGEFTYRLVPTYNEFNIMNSQDQLSVYTELEAKGWLNNAAVTNGKDSGIYGKMWSLVNDGKLLNTAGSRTQWLSENAEFINTDWFNELFNNTIMHTHSVSMSSGTEKAQYYASMSAMFDPGWTMSSSVERYTGNLNSTYNISDQVSFNIISNASYRKQLAPGTLSSGTDPVFGEVKRDFDINPYSYALNTSRTLNPNEHYVANYAPFNIKEELAQNFIDLDVMDAKFQAELKYKPIKGLALSALGSVKYSATTQEHQITDYSNQAQAYRAMATTTIRDKNPYLYTDPSDPYAVPISILPEGGIYNRSDNDMLSYDFRASAAYNTTVNNDHIMSYFAGMEINNSERQNTWFQGWGMQYSMGNIPFFAYEAFKKAKEENTQYYGLGENRSRNVAAFANATYSWRGLYTINGTFRYEGTNRMGMSTQSRWLPTWNVAGSWNIGDEEFFTPLRSVISNMNLKASYSLTADRGPSWVTNSQYVITSYNPWRPSSSDTESGLSLDMPTNSELTYEKKHELNFGTEFGLFDGRINISADWYRRDNFDLIGTTNTQGVGGFVMKYGNVASMNTTGYEATISTQNIKTRDFSWNTDLIFAHSQSRITELEASVRAIDMVSASGFGAEGYPVRALFSYDFQGLNAEGLPTVLNEKGEVTTSDINFQERDNLSHLVYEGSVDPTDYGSLGNSFKYRGVSFNVFLTYSYGNVVRLDPFFSYAYSDLSAMPNEFKDRWMNPGDEAYTNIPTIASRRQTAEDPYLSMAYNAYNYSTERIAKGDFIRLKELSVAYDFPKSVAEKLKVGSVSVRAQATNLWLIYSDDALNGQDPEFFNTGGVAVPVPKQFTLSIKIGL